MVGSIDIKLNAAAPQLPLLPVFAHVGSPSSIRLLNVPKKIGAWEITAVQLTFAYPDNSTPSVQAVKSGGVWTATIRGASLPGMTEHGVTVTADGIDENGEPVYGYVLGEGDLMILDRDSTLHPGVATHYLHLLKSTPERPNQGDVLHDERGWFFYDGSAWIPFGGGEFAKVVELYLEGTAKKLVLLDKDGTRTSKVYNSFAEFYALVRSGTARLYYYAVGSTGRKALYTAHLIDDVASSPAIRFDATGTLGSSVYTRSIAVTKSGADGIAVSIGDLTELVKRGDLSDYAQKSWVRANFPDNFKFESSLHSKIDAVLDRSIEYYPVARTFFDDARDNQASVRSFTIPYRYLRRVAFAYEIIIRGASSDQGTWDRTSHLSYQSGHEFIESESATMPIGASATFGLFGGYEPSFAGDLTFRFLKDDGTQANVRIALVSVPTDLGFSVELGNGTVSNAYAPIFTIVGKADRAVIVDAESKKVAGVDALKGIASNASQAQLIAKVNEIISIMKG